MTDRATARVGHHLSPDFDVAHVNAFACRHAGDAAVRAHGSEPASRASHRPASTLVPACNVALHERVVSPRYKLKTGTLDVNVVDPRSGCPILASGPGDNALDHPPEE